ncbi:MAG: glycerol-3-phosphate dehydrogenase subunit GlpB [Propionibacteriaceae bacterium]
MSDVVVIGAGIAGLTAALRLREQGASVTLATFGTGGLGLSQGTIDVLGYTPRTENGGCERVSQPLEMFDSLPEPHPYRMIGTDAVRRGIAAFSRYCGPELMGNFLDINRVVPTAVGVLRPTAVVPPSMQAGNLSGSENVLVVGIRQFKDFWSPIMAANLRRSMTTGTVRHIDVDMEFRSGETDPSGRTIAEVLDTPEGRARLVAAVQPYVESADVVLFPAVLGRKDLNAWREISDGLGVAVAEIPCVPPSVPGMRLNDYLVRAVKAARVRWILGSRVVGGTFRDGKLASVTLHTTGSAKELVAKDYIFAPGGFESGALALDSYGTLSESTFGLPLWIPEGELITGNYLNNDQLLFKAGVVTDADMRPVHPETGAVIASNLYAAGGLLAGAVQWSEKSGDGIAIGSAMKACDAIGGVQK